MPCQYEKLSPDPQDPCKAGAGSTLLSFQHSYREMGGRDGRILESHRPARLGYTAVSSKTLSQTRWEVRIKPKLSSDLMCAMDMPAYTHTLKHAHTQSHASLTHTHTGKRKAINK